MAADQLKFMALAFSWQSTTPSSAADNVGLPTARPSPYVRRVAQEHCKSGPRPRGSPASGQSLTDADSHRPGQHRPARQSEPVAGMRSAAMRPTGRPAVPPARQRKSAATSHWPDSRSVLPPMPCPASAASPDLRRRVPFYLDTATRRRTSGRKAVPLHWSGRATRPVFTMDDVAGGTPAALARLTRRTRAR